MLDAFLFIDVFFILPIISFAVKQIPVLIFPFMQNEESIANNVTSSESSYESYNQNLLLTQTL